MNFKSICLFLALTATAATLPAQISLIGTRANPGTQLTDVIRFDPVSGTVQNTVATNDPAVAIGSSVFDANSGAFYFRGINGLNMATFDPDSFAFVGGIDLGTAAEIDMSNGAIYGIAPLYAPDSTGNPVLVATNFNRYDIDNGIEQTLGSFSGLYGVLLDASAFNSNTGDYYFIGIDSAQVVRLYIVPTRGTSGFTFTALPISGPDVTLFALAYDNEYNVLYGLVSNDTTNTLQVQVISTNTGAMSLEADWPQFSSYQISTITFDQTTSSLILAAGNGASVNIRIYNTVTNTLSNGVLPTGVGEWEADNRQFAALKYGALAIDPFPEPGTIRFSPNPAQDLLWIDGAALRRVRVYDVSGRLISEATLNGNLRLNLQSWRPGTYYLVGEARDGSLRSGKFIKQ